MSAYSPDPDADLALSILRKIAADYASGILLEPYPDSDAGHGVIDSSWIDLTADEYAFLSRIRSVAEGGQY